MHRPFFWQWTTSLPPTSSNANTFAVCALMDSANQVFHVTSHDHKNSSSGALFHLEQQCCNTASDPRSGHFLSRLPIATTAPDFRRLGKESIPRISNASTHRASFDGIQEFPTFFHHKLAKRHGSSRYRESATLRNASHSNAFKFSPLPTFTSATLLHLAANVQEHQVVTHVHHLLEWR